MSKTMLLKILALEAKNRMQNKSTSQASLLNKKFGILSNNQDEKLYQKVCQMLSENKDIRNPITYLMDNEYYNSLNERGKERYFFELIDKYNKLKIRFENEQKKVI